MRLIAQRDSRAAVRVDGAVTGKIGRGTLVLAGIAHGDTPELIERMADKLVGLRYFEDARGRTNLSMAEAGASVRGVWSDLLGGPTAARAGLDGDGMTVSLNDERLQVGKPSPQGALAVHPDRLRIPASDRLLAADIALTCHRK